MKRMQWIRASGWGMVLAAVSLLLTILLDQSFPSSVGILLFFFANLLVTLGLGGLYARYAGQIGNAAKIALWVGMLGGAAAVVGNIGWAIGGENERSFMNSAMAVLFGGLFVFGLPALWEKSIPRWNGLAILTGFWWPFIVINANVYHWLSGRWPNVTFWPSFAMFLGMSFFLAWLGYALQSDAFSQRSQQ